MVVGRDGAVLRRFGFPPRHAETLVLPSRGCRDEIRKVLLRAFVRSVGFLWRDIGGKGLLVLRLTGLGRRDRLFPRAEGDLSPCHPRRLPLVRRELTPLPRPVSILVAPLLDHGFQYFRDLFVVGSAPAFLRLLLLQHVGQGGLQLGEAGRHGAHVALLRRLLPQDFEQGGVIGIEDGGFGPGLGAGRRCAARFPIVQTLLHVVARVLGEFLVEEVVRLLEHLARQRLLGDGSDQSGGAQLGRLGFLLLLGVRPTRRAPRLAESVGFQFPFLARPADRIW